jgi:hypothetical protein
LGDFEGLDQDLGEEDDFLATMEEGVKSWVLVWLVFLWTTRTLRDITLLWRQGTCLFVLKFLCLTPFKSSVLTLRLYLVLHGRLSLELHLLKVVLTIIVVLGMHP